MTEPSSDAPWTPLSRRAAGLPPEDLVEGVPRWLHPRLTEWLYHVLQYTDGPVTVLRPGHGLTADTQEVMTRVRIAQQPWLLESDNPALLDALDAAIRWIDWGEWPMFNAQRNQYGDPSTLEQILLAANSAWRATWQGLERRVDPTLTAAVTETIRGANTEAAGHLAAAWTAAYGRQPDPDRAYADAVKAVEALACPLVCPSNPRRTLGTVIADLGNQGAQWALAIGDTTGQPASPDRLIEMLKLLWQGQSRHAGSANSRRQTQTEAEAAVHLAATLVQWLTNGVLYRR